MLTAAVAVGSLYASVARANTDCNTTYEVRSGDTLSKISRRYYGDSDISRLHEANRSVIGRDPWLIEIGMKLFIPCADADFAVSALVADPAVETPTASALRTPLRVLSGPVRAPLIGPDLPRKGMLAEMLTEIAANGGFAVEAPVHVPVAGASLAALLTEGGFDVGFPWTRSDCAGDAGCDGLIFSDPFFDVEMGFYARDDGRFAKAERFADLAGARICRPVTTAMGDLEASGLTDSAEIVRLDTEAACLDQLVEGRVDLIAIDAEFAAILLEPRRAASEVRRLPVSTRQVLYAAVSRGHPQAAAVIAEINRGLEDLRRSGRWFAIAHRHMARYPKLAQVQPRG
jgi:polar amino acid transport system substrate-binding protein